MTCRLCLRDRQLRKSHIIPELLYRPLYGPTHQIKSAHLALPYTRNLRKGLRQALLCDDCETLLGRYESYFSSIWYGAKGLPSEIPLGVGKVVKSGLDYSLFKLFHLSILWRASAATLDDFRDVALGDQEEKLREMLLVGDPRRATDYPIGASILLRPDSRVVHGGVIGIPAYQDHNGEHLYCAVYGGCIWYYFVSRDMPVSSDVLQEDGTLSLAVLDISHIPAVSQNIAQAAAARQKKQQR